MALAGGGDSLASACCGFGVATGAGWEAGGCGAMVGGDADAESRNADGAVEPSLSSGVAATAGDSVGGGLREGDMAEFVSVLELFPCGVAGASLEASSSLFPLESCRNS